MCFRSKSLVGALAGVPSDCPAAKPVPAPLRLSLPSLSWTVLQLTPRAWRSETRMRACLGRTTSMPTTSRCSGKGRQRCRVCLSAPGGEVQWWCEVWPVSTKHRSLAPGQTLHFSTGSRSTMSCLPLSESLSQSPPLLIYQEGPRGLTPPLSH